jgi:NAD(P)H dehydrogenase (quinone)
MDLLPQLVEDGVIRGPAGNGRVSAVARADIARVAIQALQRPELHAGRTYELTGPAAASLAEVARVITASSGQPVRYEEETVEQAYASRAKYGAPDWQLEAWVSTYLAIRNGEMELVTNDVRDVTGAAPMSLAEFLTGAP